MPHIRVRQCCGWSQSMGPLPSFCRLSSRSSIPLNTYSYWWSFACANSCFLRDFSFAKKESSRVALSLLSPPSAIKAPLRYVVWPSLQGSLNFSKRPEYLTFITLNYQLYRSFFFWISGSLSSFTLYLLSKIGNTFYFLLKNLNRPIRDPHMNIHNININLP